MISLGS
ncbi:hypothetical protein CP10139811_1289, partial [Chlamydia ibidis]